MVYVMNFARHGASSCRLQSEKKSPKEGGHSGPPKMIHIILETDDKARQKIDLKSLGLP